MESTEHMTSFDTCGPTDTPDDIDIPALREKYRTSGTSDCGRKARAQYLELKGDFAEFYEVDPYTPVTPRDPIVEDIDVAVLGGGIAGLLAGAYLKKAGVEDVRVIEMGGDFGGVWYWNRFPGIQCDNDAYCYIPMLEELNYVPSKKYADGAEIFDHCRRIGKHFGLYDKAIFSTQVRDLRWDEEIKRWRISTNRGDDIRARFVVLTAGSYNRPKLPGIPGIKDFTGHNSTRRAGITTTPAGTRVADWTSSPTSVLRSLAQVQPVSSWFRSSAGTPSIFTFFSAPRRLSTCAGTSPPIRNGRSHCSPAGRRSGSAISTPGHRSKVWFSALRIWCAISGPNWGAT